jgi:ferredoxin
LVTTRKGPPIKVDASKCTGCLVCELRCSFRFEKAFNPSKALIKIRRLVGSDNEYEISFTDRCDNCGICARYCPYDALIQEKKREAA